MLHRTCLHTHTHIHTHTHTHTHTHMLCCGLNCSVVSDSATPLTVTHKALCPCGFSRQKYWSGLPCPLPGHLPNPGIKPRSASLQVDSFPSNPPGKPKNTGVGNLFLLQGIFPTQESNWHLLHCRHILYQLTYQGSPISMCLCVYIYIYIYIYIIWISSLMKFNGSSYIFIC